MGNLLGLYKLSKEEEVKLLKSITIIVDTREQKHQHILSYFDKNNILYRSSRLDVGDYSFFVPKNEDLGIYRDLYFDTRFCIERKGSLNELSGNFSNDRDRFTNEFLRGHNIKIGLLIEDSTLNDILDHNYRSKLNEKAFIASLLTFKNRYNVSVDFVAKEHAGLFIYQACYYYLREYLHSV